jgi:hypothetical protein
MLKRTFYGDSKDPREAEQEKQFYYEEPHLPKRKLTKEDLDTLDGWKDEETR